MDSIILVSEFHKLYDCPIHTRPHLADEKLNKLRHDLIQSELKELEVALSKKDPVEVLDALTDIQYVLDGAYLALGFYRLKDLALAEVHRSNLTKLDKDGKAIKSPEGKVLKGPDYEPPDMAGLLKLIR